MSNSLCLTDASIRFAASSSIVADDILPVTAFERGTLGLRRSSTGVLYANTDWGVTGFPSFLS